MCWDITKAAWYTGKNIGIATLGIVILHLSKGHLPQDKFIQNLSLYDLLVTLTLAGFDIAKACMKHGLEWSAYLTSKTGETADTLGEWIFTHKKNYNLKKIKNKNSELKPLFLFQFIKSNKNPCF